MKTTFRILVLVALAAALAQPVIAVTGPREVPDGGASALLFAMGTAGLVIARGIFRKK